MKNSCKLYGLMGLLSLLGFIGVFTEERLFLCFFAFAVDFQYFFIKSDEMMEEYMNLSASRGFYCGMAATGIIALVAFLAKGQNGYEALSVALTIGWAVAVVVHSFSILYYKFKETWGLENDKK